MYLRNFLSALAGQIPAAVSGTVLQDPPLASSLCSVWSQEMKEVRNWGVGMGRWGGEFSGSVKGTTRWLGNGIKSCAFSLLSISCSKNQIPAAEYCRTALPSFRPRRPVWSFCYQQHLQANLKLLGPSKWFGRPLSYLCLVLSAICGRAGQRSTDLSRIQQHL